MSKVEEYLNVLIANDNFSNPVEINSFVDKGKVTGVEVKVDEFEAKGKNLEEALSKLIKKLDICPTCRRPANEDC